MPSGDHRGREAERNEFDYVIFRTWFQLYQSM